MRIPLTDSQALHAVWRDPTGGVWSVGGDILGAPTRDGIAVYYGAPVAARTASIVVSAAISLSGLAS